MWSRLGLRGLVLIAVLAVPVAAHEPGARPVASTGRHDLQKVLRDWKLSTAAIINFDAQFECYEYDSVFNVERRSTGRIYFERPARGWLEQVPVKNLPAVGARGFRLESARAFCIFRTDLSVGDRLEGVTRTDLLKHSANVTRGWFTPQWPTPQEFFPYLFDAHARNSDAPDQIELKESNSNRISIEIQLQRQALWAAVDFMLDPQTLRPLAVRLKEAHGTNTFVFVFHDVRINSLQAMQDHVGLEVREGAFHPGPVDFPALPDDVRVAK